MTRALFRASSNQKRLKAFWRRVLLSTDCNLFVRIVSHKHQDLELCDTLRPKSLDVQASWLLCRCNWLVGSLSQYSLTSRLVRSSLRSKLKRLFEVRPSGHIRQRAGGYARLLTCNKHKLAQVTVASGGQTPEPRMYWRIKAGIERICKRVGRGAIHTFICSLLSVDTPIARLICRVIYYAHHNTVESLNYCIRDPCQHLILFAFKRYVIEGKVWLGADS